MKRMMLSITEQVSREMQIQNYSGRTIKSYIHSLKLLGSFSKKPIECISIQEFKDFLYYRISVDKVRSLQGKL